VLAAGRLEDHAPAHELERMPALGLLPQPRARDGEVPSVAVGALRMDPDLRAAVMARLGDGTGLAWVVLKSSAVTPSTVISLTLTSLLWAR